MKMNKKGFTLIEMLVVIAIIAILVAIIIPTVSNATTKAKEATDVANIRSTVAQYQIDQMNAAPGTTVTWPTTLNLKFPDKFTAPAESNGWTATYVSTTLNDGNGANKQTYTWKLGNLVTETSGSSTTGGSGTGTGH